MKNLKIRIMKNILIVLLALALAGCATSKGFDREKMKEEIGSGETSKAMSYLKKTRSGESRLAFPFRLAVCFTNPKSNIKEKEWKWSQDDKKKILSLEKNLRASNIINEMKVLDVSAFNPDDTAGIRNAAEKSGADAVMIIRAISDIDRYNNKYAPAYALFFPLFFAPGTDVDYLVITGASLWDTDTDYIYMSAEAEGFSKETAPELIINEENSLESAKNQSLNSLKKAILTHMQKLSGK
jgi:hypothetical protein